MHNSSCSNGMSQVGGRGRVREEEEEGEEEVLLI